MSHHLVEVPLPPHRSPDEADIVAARFWALGAVGVEERDHHLVGAFADRARAELAAGALGVGPPVDVADDTGLDQWRAHAPQAWGIPVVILPQFKMSGDWMKDPELAHKFMAAIVPHDLMVWPVFAETAAIMQVRDLSLIHI
mgnify:CR=1 FL=1